jgi:hypothetical protein
MVQAPGVSNVKHITAVIYGFHNKLSVCPWQALSSLVRPGAYPRVDHLKGAAVGWRGLPGTNPLAYYGNHKLWS